MYIHPADAHPPNRASRELIGAEFARPASVSAIVVCPLIAARSEAHLGPKAAAAAHSRAKGRRRATVRLP